jgi:hypothetical protein
MIRFFRTLQPEVRALIGGLFGILVLAIFFTLVMPRPTGVPLSVRDDDANGGMVLALWLERSGYQVRQVLAKPIQVDDVDVLFVLNPISPYTDQEVQAVRDWVRRGNTLIVAGAPNMVNKLLEPFRVSVATLVLMDDTISPAAPTLLSPPFDKVQANPIYGIRGTRPDVIPHMLSGNTPILASFQEEEGTVWISGALRPFSNRGLSETESNSSRFVLNLLAHISRDSVIGFDEAHHGFDQPLSLMGWLLGTAPGWGMIIGLVVTMIYLTLRGRRFGRAVPIPEERLRREPVEYIQAMASLFRRSGQRGEILKHYRGQLRRRLSERYAVDPKMNDIELLKTVVYRDPNIDEATLRSLLQRLSRRQVNEQELVSAAKDVDMWLRDSR